MATSADWHYWRINSGTNMVAQLDLKSDRAYSARLGKKIGRLGFICLIILTVFFFLLSIFLIIGSHLNYALMSLSPALLFMVPAIWWKRYLSVITVSGNSLTGRISGQLLANLDPKGQLTPMKLWSSLANNWQTSFIEQHLLIHPEATPVFIQQLDKNAVSSALDMATMLADSVGSKTIEPGFVAAGLMLNSNELAGLLMEHRAKPDDIRTVAIWLGRNLVEFGDRDKQIFGGVGRDWAFGYTPLLNRFGVNLSQGIISSKVHFGWLTGSRGVLAMEAALENHAHAIALIGEVGVGKSSSVSALAQRLIEGKTSGNLAYHEIVMINATDIISNVTRTGDLEYIMISLANEAAHAGHIILFLDDAEAFFTSGTGSFDGAQILQSIIGAGSINVILALTPNGFQSLKAKSPALANLITPITINEFSEPDTMHVLEDTAVGLENRNKILITYEALTAAYALSDRYLSDEAYPGKAVSLLTRSVPYSRSGIITRSSIEAAIEDMYGVKVGSAQPAEAEDLLNLEAKIHEQMINQDQAVSVVASALRRARAGVTNPRRPVGSFLFLGPTGVGKTELAKALASSYYKSEHNMIRLDMSEYQNPKDVNRLLSDGTAESSSLIMSVRQKPFSVILLDEIEKAHSSILNLLLQILDEGNLTDSKGRTVSFKDCIVIATSNAGAQSIRKHIEFNQDINDFHDELIEQLIKNGDFKPELINRFDEVVIFRPLNPDELAQVVRLMMKEINQTLSKQNITVNLTESAIKTIVVKGYDPTFGARPMRRVLQKAVEDTVATKILSGEVSPGTSLSLDAKDLSI
ncbi:MAG TPA: ATP-dependent Clp protease ATP-binding subunit [Candidatus Saccharimonadales bacterium]|nr:ATP-dependent Clp protease ATP-binding subunit [Candidatus Saccharimonadales bacterium]